VRSAWVGAGAWSCALAGTDNSSAAALTKIDFMSGFLRRVADGVKRPTEGRFITFSYMNLFGYARPPLSRL
jgi:hypothetical protein